MHAEPRECRAHVALLEAGAARVYAVDAGHGQLLGSLRVDPRVVNMERTNLGDVSLPEPVGFVTIDGNGPTEATLCGGAP
jgi:predicted rRNA methylase YqxC with S4 and FtsJ domains